MFHTGWLRTLFAALAVVCGAAVARADAPPCLPHYDVQMELDAAGERAEVRMEATWTNCSRRRVRELVFNAHSHYVVPEGEIGFEAKMLEILRMAPGEVLGIPSPPFDLHRVSLAGGPQPVALPFHYEGDTDTSLVVPLPHSVEPGKSVTVVLEFTFHIPQKQGRWSRWKHVTTLSNWLPVFAVFEEAQGAHEPEPAPGDHAPTSKCWQPTPFVPWHQPFYNEAGFYKVCATLPSCQNVACTGTVVARHELDGGRQQVEIEAIGVRDFAFLCSDRYQIFEGVVAEQPGVPAPVRVRVLAFPEHEHYAKEFVRISCEAIAAYSRWYGPYPYPDFTIAESFFGWNGNECATLVMIDERVFGMPHLAKGYADYLVSHEICHQWWYNLVGTNGYCETWMDEALASYSSNRLQNAKYGHNNELINYPRGLEWMPNIRRDDYRTYSLLGTIGRGENCPAVQEMPKYGHLVNLFSMCYDKGARIVGIIEDRLGPAAFESFMRRVCTRYRYRILRVADFRRELEEYTGESWDRFFKEWLYGSGLSDWAVEKVEVQGRACAYCPRWMPCRQRTLLGDQSADAARPVRVIVWLGQHADINERTVLGIAMPGREGYPIRIPILPQAESYQLDSPPTRVDVLAENRVRVEVQLPEEPTQIAVDPDQVLVDKDPSNNFWKRPIRWRVTPLYTFLEETDLTNAYDRWNVICGPWIFGNAYADAWYPRSTMFGARAALYRTQEFVGGVYAGYRTDFNDIVAGADGLWDHWPGSHVQLGFNIEQRLTEVGASGENQAFRSAAFARYVFQYGDSLYLPPMHFAEAFAVYQDDFLPYVNRAEPGGVRYQHAATAGLHYRIDYRTPYWDPEGGFALDARYQGGTADLEGRQQGINLLSAQFAVTKSAPDLTGACASLPRVHEALRPALEWLSDTRFAARIYGATSWPREGEFYAMGGSDLFRGFSLADRQGSTVWVGSLEWRVPLARGLTWDCCDHILGLRNVYGALFYDVGDAYVSNHSVGPVAHALGAGLRLDVAWFSFVERTTLRFDVAKTVNADFPAQFWLSVGHAF